MSPRFNDKRWTHPGFIMAATCIHALLAAYLAKSRDKDALGMITVVYINVGRWVAPYVL